MRIDPGTDLSQLPITFTGTVGDDHLDANRHLNVMWYTHFFAASVGGLWQQLGLTRELVDAVSGGMFIIESHISYLKELRVGESFSIRSRALARTPKLIHHLHVMVRQDGAICSTCEFLSAFIDMGTRRTAPFPPGILPTMDGVISRHQSLPWSGAGCCRIVLGGSDRRT